MAKKLLLGNLIEVDPTDSKKLRVKTRDGKDYTPSAKRLALFKDSRGREFTPDEWPKVTATVTCRTVGCPAEGVEFEVQIGENIDGVYRAGCGPCGQPITEIWVDEAYVPLPLDPDKNGAIKP